MKEKSIIFSIIYAGTFALNYFFASDRDIAGMFFFVGPGPDGNSWHLLKNT